MTENRIGAERTRRRLTMTDLAKKMDVSNTTISLWEKDHYKCSPTHLVKLASLFNCSVDYLLGVTDDLNGHVTKE